MKQFLRSTSPLLALVFGATVQAQLPIVDISAVTTINDQVEIRIRPDASFDGFFSALVFTIRWNDADGANLGGVQMDADAMTYTQISKSGPEQVSGPYRYQVFTGFGTATMSSVGASWAPSEEVILCSVNILNGSSVFELSDDPHTASINGTYYVSLNGQDRTGEIYTFTTPVADELTDLPGLTIQPNPTTGMLLVDLSDTGDRPLYLELFDATGRRVWSSTHTPLGDAVRTSVDMSGMASGVFFMKVSSSNGSATQRVILAGN